MDKIFTTAILYDFSIKIWRPQSNAHDSSIKRWDMIRHTTTMRKRRQPQGLRVLMSDDEAAATRDGMMGSRIILK